MQNDLISVGILFFRQRTPWISKQSAISKFDKIVPAVSEKAETPENDFSS